MNVAYDRNTIHSPASAFIAASCMYVQTFTVHLLNDENKDTQLRPLSLDIDLYCISVSLSWISESSYIFVL